MELPRRCFDGTRSRIVSLKEIFQKSPEEQTLLNEGVVSVNDNADDQSLRVLQYELSTFVCKGQYHDGLRKILENYLSSLASGREQKAVWISGFFGSGKSHLAKIVRALWTNQKFPDGQRALDIVTLPQDIRDLFVELQKNGNRLGGLYSVSGTLSAGESDFVRMTVLSMLFRSKGLPEKYNQAKFCLWLRDEGVLEQVKTDINAKGKDFNREVENLFVSTVLWDSLLKALPGLGSVESLKVMLREQFKAQNDVSDTELVDVVKRTLSEQGKMPLTLIVLDEVQQFIGLSSETRPLNVQELVETLCKAFGSRILFVGTGQNAISGTSSLQKLMGRFTIAVNLSDNDVDTVVRENILKKRPDRESDVKRTLEAAQGEIDSHLSGTPLSPQRYEHEDSAWMVADYPLLPVRRRFWETALKSADRTGTASQLRNQLRMVFEAVKQAKDRKLGYVVPSDFLYEQNVVSFEQTGILPRELRTVIEKLKNSSTASDVQKGRILSIVFLLGKINEGRTSDRIPSTLKTIEDLLITDLSSAHELKRVVGTYCDELVQDGNLLKTGDEYQVQTKEGVRWTQEFKRFHSQLGNDPEKIAQLRREQLYQHLDSVLGRLSMQQGNVKVSRTITRTTERGMPAASEPVVWIRNGWEVSEDAALRDARQAGQDSPLITVFLPKLANDQVITNLKEWKAAKETLEYFGVQSSAEGRQAWESMDSRRKTAEDALKNLWAEIVDQAKIWIGGGIDVSGISVSGKVDAAIEKALTRTYPEFSKADNPKWAEVIEAAQRGSIGCLDKLGYAGDPKEQPVCAEILRKIQNVSTWNDVRASFEKPPYGWWRDTIDGALYALWINGVIAVRRSGKDLAVGDVPRKDIGGLSVVPQIIVITTSEKIKIRGVYQDVGVRCQGGEETLRIQDFRERVTSLRAETGGRAPLPDAVKPAWWEEFESESGLSFLKFIACHENDLKLEFKRWKEIAEKKTARLSGWETFERLLLLAGSLSGAADLKRQYQALLDNRSLLADPDPVPSVMHTAREMLHEALRTAYVGYRTAYDRAVEMLNTSNLWNRLDDGKRSSIMDRIGFALLPEPEMGSADALIASLSVVPIDTWKERSLALESKANALLEAAAKELEPKVQTVNLPRPGTPLASEADLDVWLSRVRELLVERLKQGPILPK